MAACAATPSSPRGTPVDDRGHLQGLATQQTASWSVHIPVGRRPLTEPIAGFILLQRLDSLCQPSRRLSFLMCRDEAAAMASRRIPTHHIGPALDLGDVFRGCDLRQATQLLRGNREPRPESNL
jgi:hypothetical protein